MPQEQERQTQLLLAATAAGITLPKELANFMRQMPVESGDLSLMKGNLHSSGYRLLEIFPVRKIICLLACLVPCLCWAQNNTPAPVSDKDNQSIANKPPASAGSLCASNEYTVFSCVLKKNRKSVSLCAAGDWRSEQRKFYYIYGHLGKPEMIYPSRDQSIKNPFMRTHLFFLGDTGGYTYSFINENFEYIIYSISGRYNYRNAGMIIRTPPNNRLAIQDMSCRKTSIFDLYDQTFGPYDKIIQDITLKWPSEPDIQTHNLPVAH